MGDAKTGTGQAKAEGAVEIDDEALDEVAGGTEEVYLSVKLENVQVAPQARPLGSAVKKS